MFDNLPDYDGELDGNALTFQQDLVPKFDPVAYFEEFCHLHGGEGPPMQFGAKLLFADGWAYDAYNHEGPEYRPPEDSYSLLRARALYWTLRRKLVARHREEHIIRTENLRQLQEFKSAPLMASRMVVSKNGKRVKYVTEPINFDRLDLLREQMDGELNLCDEKLDAIRIELKNTKVSV